MQLSKHFYILSLKIMTFSTVEIKGKSLVYILQLMTTYEFLGIYNIQPYIFKYVRFCCERPQKFSFCSS